MVALRRLFGRGPAGDAGVERAFSPHCDQWVLHAPGVCVHCDKYPDWQQYRQVLHMAFTGEEAGDSGLPCPATQRRPLEVLERWYGNVPERP